MGEGGEIAQQPVIRPGPEIKPIIPPNGPETQALNPIPVEQPKSEPQSEMPLSSKEQRQVEEVKRELRAERAQQLKDQIDALTGNKSEIQLNEIAKSPPNIIARIFQWLASLFRFHPKQT